MPLYGPSRFRFWIVLFASLATASLQGADPWPRFRGPGGDGVATAADADALPIRWGPDENVTWRTELPGQGWSSPVIGGDTIYLSAAIPAEGQEKDFDLCLILVDARSGQVARVSQLMRQEGEAAPKIHNKNSHASPTPILAEDRVYVHFGHQGTACTSRSGDLIWTQRDLAFPPVHGNGGSPILADDKLVFTCDGGKEPYVVALNTRDGSVAWRTPRPVDAERKFSFCTPTQIEVDGRRQIVAPGSDCVVALDPASGHVSWQVRYDGYSVVPKPVFDGRFVYITTGFGPTTLMAIRPDGRGDVTDSHVVWEFDKGIPKTPSLILHEEMVFLVSDDGIAMALEADAGRLLWRKRLGGNYSASPLLVGEHLYFTSESGTTTVIKAAAEFEQIAESDLDERTLASLAVADQAIYLRTAAALYRLEKD